MAIMIFQISSTATTLVAWGAQCWASGPGFIPFDLPAHATNLISVAGGTKHTLGLRMDGTLVAWGCPFARESTNVPVWLTNVVAIDVDAGDEYSGLYINLALRSDGTSVGCGTFVPSPTNLFPGHSNLVAIAAGTYICLGLKADGTLSGWPLPAPSTIDDVVAIAARGVRAFAVKGDGSLVTWTSNTNIPSNLPAGLSNVVAVSAGAEHALALLSDGTVRAWWSGEVPYFPRDFGQTAVPDGLSNVVAIAAGDRHNLALKADGTVVAWGEAGPVSSAGAAIVPDGLTNVTAIAAGLFQSLAIVGVPAPSLAIQPESCTFSNGVFGVSTPSICGRDYFLEYKDSMEDAVWRRATAIVGDGTTRTLSDPVAIGSQRFYRLRQQ